ncbi:YdcF family protein [Nocardia sp. NPDC005978]|uniref:YdcF family protein n=1 Tax=Nocardia sp. NPDC005978 TaxID=3156725 RepID=UPI0033B2EDE6
MTQTLLLGGAVLALFGAVRVLYEPRHISTGLVLLCALGLLALWAAVELGARWYPWGVILILVLPPVSLVLAGLGLLANGVIVTRREGLRISTAVAPVVGLALLALPFAAIWAVGAWPHAPIWATATAVIVTLLGLLLLAQLLAFTVYAILYAQLPYRSGADAVVVLGCGLVNGRVTPLLATRLDRALEVYREEVAAGAFPVLVVSGGVGRGKKVAEADAMGDYLEAAGIDPAMIIRERRSGNTEENLRFTAAELATRGFAEDARITVVTSDFHVMRTAALTRRQGMDAQAVGARTARYFVPAAFLREFAAVIDSHRRVNLVAGGTLVAVVLGLAVYASCLPNGLEAVS